MAALHANSLAAISTLVSYAYLSQTLERHSLAGRPRLSSLLLLLLSGALCFLASIFSNFLPGSHGRFDSYQRAPKDLPSHSDDDPTTKARDASSAQPPPRPRRYSVPLLVVCIVVRLELFHRVNFQQHCAIVGLESFLPVLLWLYETASNPMTWVRLEKRDDDPNDPWRSVFDDISDWLSGPQLKFLFTLTSLALISTSTFLSVRQFTPSTYVCFAPIAYPSYVMALQAVGLCLDAVIVVLFWRMLLWSRTTKLRLRTLGSVLVLSSALMGAVWLGHRISRGAKPLELTFGSLYAFDLIFDSILFGILSISAAFWVCSSTTVLPATIITMLVGLQATWSNIRVAGDWDHLSRTQVLFPLWLISLSTVWFSYSQPITRFIFLRRGTFIFFLLICLGVGTIYGLSRPRDWDPRHPVADIMFKSQREHSKWVSQSKISMSLPVAATVYKETYGRHPPPFFHEWYGIAKSTAVLDTFDQIEDDLKPFRSIPPKILRERAELAASLPGVATITIEKGGKVRHSDAGNDKKNKEIEQLVEIISKYSEWLPELTIPVNLDHQPRILPSWQKSQSIQHADLSSITGLVQSDGDDSGNLTFSHISAKGLQDMHLEACAPNSKIRKEPHWRVGEFCGECTRRHSNGPLLTKWDRSLQICQQPDIHQLHGFFLTDSATPPVDSLLPLFGPSKMEGFKDILFPLPSSIEAEDDIKSEFSDRYDNLLWRGEIGERALSAPALSGSHKFRLMHLVTDPAPGDRSTIVLSEGVAPLEYFHYETLSTADAGDVIPFSAGFKPFDHCTDVTCTMIKQAYPQDTSSSSILSYRYVLLTDEDDGPPRGFMSTLRSGSVPFLATVFRTWYSERLTPWLHFVPIDLRYQGLYTTHAYFSGTVGRKPINGRDTRMKAQREDAEWIAHQGRNWAKKAIGKADMEVYIFRLLLEWGRLVDDKRDEIGFFKDEKGELKSKGWTLRGSKQPS